MSGRTPGPWTLTVEDDGSVDDAVSTPNEEAGVGDIVCLSPAHGGYRESAVRWEANARLIAAAPDLLEALQLLFGPNSRVRITVLKTAGNNPLDVARAAIAKATGAA